jgi:hypothetical protein
MVKHIVFWKLRDEYEGLDKQQLAREIKATLEEMSTHLPMVKHFEVGIGIAKEDMTSDIALYAEFATWEDLQAYQGYPEHVKFKDYIQSRRTERRVIDYEV